MNVNTTLSIPLGRNRDGVSLNDILEHVPRLMVRQSLQMSKILFGIQQNNEYSVEKINANDERERGEVIFVGLEQSNCCTLLCGGPERKFEMTFRENQGNSPLKLRRGRGCCEDCCRFEFCSCCRDRELMTVTSYGSHIGSICQPACVMPCMPQQLLIKNRYGDTVYRLGRPCDCCQCTCDCSCNCCPCDCCVWWVFVQPISLRLECITRHSLETPMHLGCCSEPPPSPPVEVFISTSPSISSPGCWIIRSKLLEHPVKI